MVDESEDSDKDPDLLEAKSGRHCPLPTTVKDYISNNDIMKSYIYLLAGKNGKKTDDKKAISKLLDESWSTVWEEFTEDLQTVRRIGKM